MSTIEAKVTARALVMTRDGDRPAWTSAIETPGQIQTIRPDRADGSLDRELRDVSAVFIDAGVGAPLSVARRVHRMAPGVQIAIIAEHTALEDLRRAMLFAPGIGEVWLVEPHEVTTETIERACSVGSSRRRSTVRSNTVAREIARMPRTEDRRVVLADRYLAVLLELLPDPVVALDDDDSVLFANPAATTLLKLDGEARASGAEIRARLAPVDPAALDTLLAAGRRAPAAATLALRPNGPTSELCTYDIAIAPTGGERPARALLLHDVTEQVAVRTRLEEQAAELEAQGGELQQQNEELQAQAEELEMQREQLTSAMKHRSRFYASMSHELRTPINAIIGYNDLMLSGVYGAPDEPQTIALERIQHAATHLLELVNDVLDLSKIEAGKFAIVPERIDVASLIDDLASTMQPLADANDVEVRFHAGGRCDASFVTDPRRLRQIIMNLLSNAIRYGDGRPVDVCCRIEDGSLRVDVEDRGPGIPPEQLEGIFDEFVQVGSADAGGTGLGLAIGRALAHALGGSLSVTSEVGKGSTFTVLVPELDETADPTELTGESE